MEHVTIDTFGGDVLEEALRLVFMEKYRGGRPFANAAEGFEAVASLRFARYILEHPKELEDAKKLMEQFEFDKPKP